MSRRKLLVVLLSLGSLFFLTACSKEDMSEWVMRVIAALARNMVKVSADADVTTPDVWFEFHIPSTAQTYSIRSDTSGSEFRIAKSDSFIVTAYAEDPQGVKQVAIRSIRYSNFVSCECRWPSVMPLFEIEESNAKVGDWTRKRLEKSLTINNEAFRDCDEPPGCVRTYARAIIQAYGTNFSDDESGTVEVRFVLKEP